MLQAWEAALVQDPVKRYRKVIRSGMLCVCNQAFMLQISTNWEIDIGWPEPLLKWGIKADGKDAHTASSKMTTGAEIYEEKVRVVGSTLISRPFVVCGEIRNIWHFWYASNYDKTFPIIEVSQAIVLPWIEIMEKWTCSFMSFPATGISR